VKNIQKTMGLFVVEICHKRRAEFGAHVCTATFDNCLCWLVQSAHCCI